MAFRISMSSPPDGVFVSTPRIVGWTERTYMFYFINSTVVLPGFLCINLNVIAYEDMLACSSVCIFKSKHQCATIIYASCRIQSVCCGVPHGSVLEPRFFVLCTNDIYCTKGGWWVRLLAGNVALYFVNTDLMIWNLVDIVHSLKRPLELQCANSFVGRPSSLVTKFHIKATALTKFMRTCFANNCNCDAFICVHVLCWNKVTSYTTSTMVMVMAMTNCLHSVESPPAPMLLSNSFIQPRKPVRRKIKQIWVICICKINKLV